MATDQNPSPNSCYYLKLLLLTVFFSLHLQTIDGARALPHQQSSTDFITTSCRSTLYPDLCFSSLSSYASTIQTSPILLAQTALSITINSSYSASAAMKLMCSHVGMRPRVAAAMSDCMDNMGNSIDDLRESLGLMEHMGGRDVRFQLNSIQTWVSAALTDDDTCMDGFEGGETEGAVKEAVRSNVVKVAELTSNALAFINCLASSSQEFP